jgi:hypothetical protein
MLNNGIEIDGSAIDDDHFNFGVGYTQRLDHIFDRGSPLIIVLNESIFLGAWQEEIERVVKTEVCGGHG